MPASTFVHDWLAERPSATGFLPPAAPTAAIAERRARQGASRSRLQELFRKGLGDTAPSAAQRVSLEAVGDQRSVVAITGQQIGLLGGPLYTIFKIASTVTVAERMTAHLERPVVPVFWLEDNDHDAAEAASAIVPQADGSIVHLAAWDGTATRRPVHRQAFTTTDVDAIAAALGSLTGPDADGVRARAAAIYREGRPWAEAFLDVLQPWLAHWGVLVVRGSHVVEQGLHAPMLAVDANDPTFFANHVAAADARLADAGYHSQARLAPYAFFLEHDGERHRLRPLDDGRCQVGATIMEAADVRTLALDHPERWSPTALARPVVQDAILPTIATVLGPAELAYHAQLADVYPALGIVRPTPLIRHMGTVLDPRTERLLEKTGATVESLWVPWEQRERTLAAELQATMGLREVDADAIAETALADVASAAHRIDPTLDGSVRAAQASIAKAIAQLDGKIRAAVKRTHADIIARNRSLAGAVYPADTLQERVMPMLVAEARCGTENFRTIVERLRQSEHGVHVVIGCHDISGERGLL